MKTCLLLLIASLTLFAATTPSQATFWNNDWNKDGGFSWSDNWGDKSWDGWDGWNDKSWDDNKDWWDNKDWSSDWPKEHTCDRWCGCKDNPVPEPATAGLSMMGLAALGFATRRRR